MGVRGTRELEYVILRAGAFPRKSLDMVLRRASLQCAAGFGVSHSRAADASAPLGLGGAAAAWRRLGLRGRLLAGPHVA